MTLMHWISKNKPIGTLKFTVLGSLVITAGSKHHSKQSAVPRVFFSMTDEVKGISLFRYNYLKNNLVYFQLD